MYTLEDGSKVQEIPDNYTGMLTTESGTKAWYQYGKRHRLDGPASEVFDGSKAWYQDGNRHRIDGPAVELADGSEHVVS
jgi:hypothetical protein